MTSTMITPAVRPRRRDEGRAGELALVMDRGPRDGRVMMPGSRRSFVGEHLAHGEAGGAEGGQEARDDREDRDGEEPEHDAVERRA